MKITQIILLIICLLANSNQAYASDTAPLPSATDGLRYVITPYLWFLGMNGKVDYNNVQRVDTKIDTNKLLSTFDIGGMLEGEVHYGRWGVAGNGIYSKSSSLSSKSYLKDQALTVGSNTTSWIGIYTVAGTYTAVSSPYIYIDTLAGARFLNLNSKVALNASVTNTPYTGDKTLYSTVSATDAIGGVKGRVRVSESNFYVPFYVDAGGGQFYSEINNAANTWNRLCLQASGYLTGIQQPLLQLKQKSGIFVPQYERPGSSSDF